MAKVRIGHVQEARVLEAMGVDFIDESEVLTPADDEHHIAKHDYRVPFVCGARNLGEALRRIAEGAAMIRTKGEAGSGNIVEAVRHLRSVIGQMRAIQAMPAEELMATAKNMGAPYDLVRYVHENGKLPVAVVARARMDECLRLARMCFSIQSMLVSLAGKLEIKSLRGMPAWSWL